MAEILKTPQLGEMTQRFIEFVMMQAQQAALFLGRIPNPQTGKPEVRLDVAKLFIDQLEMIREKTRGNLSNQESEILAGVLSDLQMAYVEASSGSPEAPVAEKTSEPEAPAEDAESRKKFTKSYGA